MCGVFGIIGDYNPQKAREALQKIAHRGRDHCGIVEQKNLFLAHNRLSITDPHPRSHQPMSRGKILISFNGEIYNHLDLRKNLAVQDWRGHSDTETLLAGFDNWGITGTVKRAIGMFAFAVWDKKTQTLTLARDRLLPWRRLGDRGQQRL